MRVLVALEARFFQSTDGRIYSSGANTYAFWQRYLKVFESISVLARVRKTTQSFAESLRADGFGVEFCILPDFHGPERYMLRRKRVKAAISAAVADADAYVLRLPGIIGTLAAKEIKQRNRSFAIEVVGDPYDVFGPKAVSHPFRPLFRRMFTRQLRDLCQRACAVAYVTERTLQCRYPPSSTAFATHYSSIELADDDFASGPRLHDKNKGSFRIVTVGTLEQLYKAPDVLIEAVARCLRRGLDVELLIVGDGRCCPKLERQAATRGLNGRVHFMGHMANRTEIRWLLDSADLFVLPSRQEGLPRAMLEAMARGLPCIGSTAGGIPELLPSEFLVPPNNAVSLAEKIERIHADPETRRRASARNLECARTYHASILEKQRTEFYGQVRSSATCTPKGDG